MRSPSGPVLVIAGLVMTVLFVALVFTALNTRSELEATRGELAALRAAVEGADRGVTPDELEEQLVELEGGIRDWLIATGADGALDASPGTEGAASTAIVERLDQILVRIEALDTRLDQICEGVPVC